MIEQVRLEYDGGVPNKLNQIMPYKTEIHQQEIRCNVCGKSYFVDEETFSNFEKKMKYDLDIQFLCEDCEQDYQDAAFE